MILASAQTKPKGGDIIENLNNHYRFIERAADYNADLIVFPEMSITGYEREEAHKMCFFENDPRLDKLRRLSVDHDIIIIAGAPIKTSSNLFIGAFVISPDNTVAIYTKQYLHLGEDLFYQSSFKYNPTIELKNEKVSLAICADIDNPTHPHTAYDAKSTIYIASIFFTPNGITSAHASLSTYAAKYSFNVLMANYCGQSWSVDSGGRSAFWGKNGKLIAEMDDISSGLLIVENQNGIWTGKIVKEE